LYTNRGLQPAPSSPIDTAFWLERARRDRLAVLLDLDGTLIPFAPTVEEAELDAPAVRLLDALAQAGVQVAIVSGRPRSNVESLRQRLPHAWFTAEHGVWRSTGEDWTGPREQGSELDSLQDALAPFASTPGARLERKTLSLCVHWRNVAEEHRENLIAAVELLCDEWLESQPDYERLEGVAMLEVRRQTANKGAAVQWIRARLPDAYLLAIGDDHTDEDMFAALHDDEIGIAVDATRRRRSRGRAWLAGPSAVRDFLWWLVEVRSRPIDRPPPIDHLNTLPSTRPRSRLVVVSNRTPLPPTGDRPREVGGLVTALEAALRTSNGIWLGWSGQEREGRPVLMIDDESQPARASFDYPPGWRQRFYSGFCNRALWPLLHGFPSRVRYSDDDWKAYVEANDTYGKFAAELADPEGAIWLHDYHVLLVPRVLRRLGHVGPIGLFIHVPFPPRDLFETLPWCDDILDAMRELDVVGFHTEQWGDNFRACVRALDHRQGKAGRMPAVQIAPIGIDALDFARNAEDTDRDVLALRSSLQGRRLILGVDRLDYAKGIPERLVAFERLLETRPEWRGAVSFIQISVPSRSDVPEYAELRHNVETLVGRINGRFGEADWVPVRYLYRGYDQRVLGQLYRLADVGLVTPLRDGLNLVAKEFVAAQDPERPGVLILSRFAGAAVELRDAVLTNPYHPDGLASDIDRALRMPLGERCERHARLATVVARTTPLSWATHFLGGLVDARPPSRA
jgi:alpha,alpha-trehalose-phosphate synthase [UDP-forming]/trehalose-phosphatase